MNRECGETYEAVKLAGGSVVGGTEVRYEYWLLAERQLEAGAAGGQTEICLGRRLRMRNIPGGRK
jgi:hypothetical protein